VGSIMKTATEIVQDDMHDEDVDGLIAAQEQRIALTYISEAFDKATDKGIAPDAVAHAAIFQALVIMVEIFGEEPVAHLMGQNVSAIRNGRYTMHDIMH
jgi:cyanophycinase-like exopeptidase